MPEQEYDWRSDHPMEMEECEQRPACSVCGNIIWGVIKVVTLPLRIAGKVVTNKSLTHPGKCEDTARRGG